MENIQKINKADPTVLIVEQRLRMAFGRILHRAGMRGGHLQPSGLARDIPADEEIQRRDPAVSRKEGMLARPPCLRGNAEEGEEKRLVIGCQTYRRPAAKGGDTIPQMGDFISEGIVG